MKTADTSFRKMLQDTIGNELYPCASDLRLKLLDLNAKKVVYGHYPCIVGVCIIKKPYHAVFLRCPIDRILSLIHHRKRCFPELRSLSISEIPERNIWINQPLRNYQTKIFVINDLSPPSINLTNTITKNDYQRAA